MRTRDEMRLKRRNCNLGSVLELRVYVRHTHYQNQGRDIKLDVRLYREGLGKAGAVTSLGKDFTTLHVPRMCAQKTERSA